MTEQKILDAHFNLVESAIEACFTVSKNKIKIKERMDFADKSVLLKIWCDCSDNFEYEKLKKLIKEYNLKLYNNLAY